MRPPGWLQGTGRVVRERASLAAVALLAACSLVGGGQRRPSPPGGPPTPRVEAPGRPAEPGPELRRFREVRGLWVVRSSMNTRAGVRAMVARAADAGFNTLLVQVRGRGDAFYTSRWEPRAETLRGQDGSFDPLGYAVEEAHRRGLAIHAWVNTHLVGGAGELPASADHLVRAHPEWLAVPEALGRELYDMDPRDEHYVQALLRFAQENTRRIEGLYTSPSDPDVKERVYSVWMDLVERYDLDGIHFDYVRYPGPEFDYSRGALQRFRAWVEPRLSPERRRDLERAEERDPYAFAGALPGPWGEFRRAQITDLVERIYHGVKARKPHMVVSAAVFANRTDAYRNRFQDWPRWLREGIVDAVAPMAYTADDDRFRAFIHDAREQAGYRARVWAGVGAYRNTLDGTVRQIEIAREEDAGGVILFSYDWTVKQDAASSGEPYLLRLSRAAFGRR